jgi:hypothetical protein
VEWGWKGRGKIVETSARSVGVDSGEMHSSLPPSRALLATALLALAAAATAQAPPAPTTASAGAGATDAALLEAGKGRIRGPVQATARAALESGEIALLIAHQLPGAPAKGAYALLVFGAGTLELRGHDEIDGLDAPGALTVSLSIPSTPVASGALIATVGVKGADGSGQERTYLYRFGGGRLSRLHMLPTSRSAPPGSALPGVAHDVEVLPTASGGFKDIRVRSPITECGAVGDCVERLEVTSYTFDGVRYAARPFAIPFVETVSASSHLSERGGLADRSAAAALDGRLDTAWCEGAKGAGWFEKLELTFLPAQQLKAVTVFPGIGVGDAYRERTRPKRIRVLLPDGRKVEGDLADEPRAQRIALPAGDRVFGMTIVILDVFKGRREDACIRELDLEVVP